MSFVLGGEMPGTNRCTAILLGARRTVAAIGIRRSGSIASTIVGTGRRFDLRDKKFINNARSGGQSIKEKQMKTLVLLFALTVGLVSVTGCHWNHHHHNHYAGFVWR